MTITMEAITATSYVESVRLFVAASPWLTDADMPQLRALLGIATDLDASPKARTSAMFSQFTLIQRTLAAKAPGAPAAAPGGLAEFLDNPESMAGFMLPPQVVGAGG